MKIDLLEDGTLPTPKMGVFFRQLADGNYYCFNFDGKPCDLEGKIDPSAAGPIKETEEEIRARLKAEIIAELKAAQLAQKTPPTP